MCGHFVMLTFDEVLQVVQCLEFHTPFNALPDWPARPSAYPGSEVPVIVPGEGGLQARPLRWGFEASWQKGLVFNTRIETALGPRPGLWREPIRDGRCIVATGGFFEPHRSQTRRSPRTGRPVKQQYLFQSHDDTPLLLAAVAGDGCFSVVTTVPNGTMASIHDRMPLVLRPREVPLWLGPDFAALADRTGVTLDVQREGNDAEGGDDSRGEAVGNGSIGAGNHMPDLLQGTLF